MPRPPKPPPPPKLRPPPKPPPPKPRASACEESVASARAAAARLRMILRDIVVLRVGVGGRSEFQCPWDRELGERFKRFFDGRNRVISSAFAAAWGETGKKPERMSPPPDGLPNGVRTAKLATSLRYPI